MNVLRTKPCRHCTMPFTTALNFIVYCSLACAFWSKVDVRGPEECWPWTAGRDNHNYGVLRYKKVAHKASRVALALSLGTIPSALAGDALHACDNPPCCNPAHLRPGTQADNVADAVVRGRLSRQPKVWGEKHPAAKLNVAAVQFIRASDLPRKELARRFGITESSVYLVRRRKTWRHVA